ncbi:MAG: flippase-like domain-containing protein [Candidatus Diapherotrites archaeon]|uniref:Flippase-like domain-containing protein n=1 Tax=Candidatus Iainarchaeum sp. TaxID=3101447 RepID=A0A8T4C6C6_9ARCH|nr:flippase-like domain-containing protein [Candidatus Diapherotrites archaeon]
MKIPYLTIFFTLIILYVAATQLNWPSLLHAFQSAKIEYIFLALSAWVVLVFLKGFKWQRLVISLNGKISLIDSLMVIFIGLFVSVITPGRLGDFVRAVYIKDRLALGKGILAVIVDRAMDVITLLIFAGIGLILLTRAKGIEIISPELVLILIAGSFMALGAGLNKRVARKLFKLFQGIIPQKIRELLLKHGRSFYEAVPLFQTNGIHVLAAVFSSTAAWLLSITFGWFLMLALNMPLSWNSALAVVPVLALIEIIPVGILGIGTREIGAVIVLGAFGISPESAVAYSLLYFALGYIPSFAIGAVLFNHKPLPMDGGLKGLASRLG